MRFDPYELWQQPRVVAFQRDDIRALSMLLQVMPKHSHLLLHCPGHDGRPFFARAAKLQSQFSHVRFHLMANTHAELRLYRETFGLPCGYGPTSLFVSEHRFRILNDTVKNSDALYVARFEPFWRSHCKRLPLARRVRSLKIVTYCLGVKTGFKAAFRQTFPELSHAPVNDFPLSQEQMVAEFNAARVHLALSAEEGCVLAFTEGLLCGVPAVSTRCRSARTEFFSHQDVLVCDADALAIARAVEAMIETDPTPRAVRERALSRLGAMREEYARYVGGLVGASEAHVATVLFHEGADRLRFHLAQPAQPQLRSPSRYPRSHRSRLADQKRRFSG